MSQGALVLYVRVNNIFLKKKRGGGGILGYEVDEIFLILLCGLSATVSFVLSFCAVPLICTPAYMPVERQRFPLHFIAMTAAIHSHNRPLCLICPTLAPLSEW